MDSIFFRGLFFHSSSSGNIASVISDIISCDTDSNVNIKTTKNVNNKFTNIGKY